jgi:5,10-methylenetetrahydromethanopterin reductase
MVGKVQLWTWGALTLGDRGRGIEEQVESAESSGWDGLVFNDSQNTSPDTFAALAIAARTSTNLRLGTGVTNPFTRHPVVMASIAATLQSLSGGRFELGIGRGDTALSFVGRKPPPLGLFESYINVVKNHLHGVEVPFADLSWFNSGGAPEAQTVGVVGTPTASRLLWLDDTQPAPIDVVGSGPKVIDIAGRLGDSVSLSVGADPQRVEAGISTARTARASAGLDPASLPVGLYLNILAHPDKRIASELAHGMVTAMSKYSAKNRAAKAPDAQMNATESAGLRNASERGEDASITDRFGVVGKPAQCVEKLKALIELGVTKIVVVPANPLVPGYLDPNRDLRKAHECMVAEVLPALRQMTLPATSS